MLEKTVIGMAEKLCNSRMNALGLEFHNWEHVQDMVSALERYKMVHGMPQKLYENMLLAILFHDTGLAKGRRGHEKESGKIAAQFLAENGFPQKRIGEIVGLIHATDITKKPQTETHRLMRDFDIANTGMGWNDFIRRTQCLYREFRRTGVFGKNNAAWLEFVSRFVKPRYFSQWANSIYGNNHKTNSQKLKSIISKNREIATAGHSFKIPAIGNVKKRNKLHA